MGEKEHEYRLTLEYLKDNKGALIKAEPIKLEFDNHDDIFSIIKVQEEKNIFNDKKQSVEFIIGLKLFSEIMLKNRDNSLFDEMRPAFRNFMKKLKEL